MKTFLTILETTQYETVKVLRGALLTPLVECQTLNRKVASSNLTRDAVLCP